MTATYIENYLDEIHELRSFDIQKLMLKKIMMINDIIKNILNVKYLIWFEFIHSCDIDLDSTHEKNYAMCIEWTKLSEKENRLLTTWWLHVIETMNLKQCYQ